MEECITSPCALSLSCGCPDILVNMAHHIAKFMHRFNQVGKLQFADSSVGSKTRQGVLHEGDTVGFVLCEGGVIFVVAVIVALRWTQHSGTSP